MRTTVAALLLLCSVTPGQAADCSEPLSAMRQLDLKYRSSVAELRMMERDLGPVGTRSEEAVLRSLRRYGQAQKVLRDQRMQIIALYRSLVADECEPFDQQGLDQTVKDFRFYTDEEEKALISARKMMGASASIR